MKNKISLSFTIVLFLLLMVACQPSLNQNDDKSKDSGEELSVSEIEKDSEQLVVAQVNGKNIYQTFVDKSYLNWLYQYEKNMGEGAVDIDYCGRKQSEIMKTKILNAKIKGILIEEYYAEKNETLSDEELEVKYEELMTIIEKNQPEITEFYKENGIDKDFLLDSIKSNYYLEKFAQDIDMDYREEYSLSEIEFKNSKLNIKPRIILLDNKELADDVYKKLQNGEKFENMVEKYSLDEASKSRGGELGSTKFEEMPIDFSVPVFKLMKNKVSEPFKSIFGYNIVEVLDFQTVEDMLNDEELSEYEEAAIKDLLYKRALNVKIYNAENDLLEKASIDIYENYYLKSDTEGESK